MVKKDTDLLLLNKASAHLGQEWRKSNRLSQVTSLVSLCAAYVSGIWGLS